MRTRSVPEQLRAFEVQYSGAEERPLGSYALLLAIYGGIVGAMVTAARARGAKLPERLPAADLALLTAGTYRASRLIAKDDVTSVARAPFTRFEGYAGDGEVNETPRGRGMRRVVGELITTPTSIAVWVASVGTFGMITYPRTTRLVCSTLTAVTGSDLLEFGRQARLARQSGR